MGNKVTPNILLIDSNFLAHQVRTTLPELTDSRGVQTGILYGFLARLSSIMERFGSNSIVLCWDSKTSFRKKLFPDYKVKRHSKETQEEHDQRMLIMKQFTLVRTVLKSVGFTTYCKKGLEGDDLFGSIVYSNPDKEFTLVTADGDMYQLLSDKVIMYNPSSKKITTEKTFKEKYGVDPQQWGLVKAIGGCTSDCVPGVKGVGEKKAIQYIHGEIKPHLKAFQAIELAQQDGTIDLFKQLTVLPFDTTPPIKLPKNLNWDDDLFFELCQKYDLQSFLNDRSKWESMCQGVFAPSRRSKIEVKKKGFGV